MDLTRVRIRPYRPSDLDALYRICLLTGDEGQDATSLFADPHLVRFSTPGCPPRGGPDCCRNR
jgi:hypothetical protein